MANPRKSNIIDDLRQRFGVVRKLKGSESLFAIGDEAARIYFRYSKVHAGGRTFFGLRDLDCVNSRGITRFFVSSSMTAPLLFFFPTQTSNKSLPTPNLQETDSIKFNSQTERILSSFTWQDKGDSTWRAMSDLKHWSVA